MLDANDVRVEVNVHHRGNEAVESLPKKCICGQLLIGELPWLARAMHFKAPAYFFW
jgi:hypothetical protein